MVYITSKLLDKKMGNIRLFLNYPKIDVDIFDVEIEMFSKIVNNAVENEVKIFEDIVVNTYFEEQKGINAMSEFTVAFNKGNIVSIPIEFSQIFGLTDISHICSYNYDFNLMRKITLLDIFKSEIDFEKIIEGYIMEKIYDILDDYKMNISCDVYDLMAELIYICEDPVFYFNGRELIVCISSFELTNNICNLIEFPISFNKIKNILSDYALKNIYLY